MCDRVYGMELRLSTFGTCDWDEACTVVTMAGLALGPCHYAYNLSLLTHARKSDMAAHGQLARLYSCRSHDVCVVACMASTRLSARPAWTRTGGMAGHDSLFFSLCRCNAWSSRARWCMLSAAAGPRPGMR